MACLFDAGREEREAAWTCWTIIYFTLGLAQEEQQAAADDGAKLAAALAPHAHPALTRTADQLTETDFHARHEFGLTLTIDTLPTGPPRRPWSAAPRPRGSGAPRL